jgi:hypothetical protein
MRILDRVEHQLLDEGTAGSRAPDTTIHTRPTLELWDAPWFAWHMITWAPR